MAHTSRAGEVSLPCLKACRCLKVFYILPQEPCKRLSLHLLCLSSFQHKPLRFRSLQPLPVGLPGFWRAHFPVWGLCGLYLCCGSTTWHSLSTALFSWPQSLSNASSPRHTCKALLLRHTPWSCTAAFLPRRRGIRPRCFCGSVSSMTLLHDRFPRSCLRMILKDIFPGISLTTLRDIHEFNSYFLFFLLMSTEHYLSKASNS